MVMIDLEKVIKAVECRRNVHKRCGNPCELKEHEPSKPTVSEKYGVKFYYCPKCARPIVESVAYGHPRFCQNCRKGLIWDDK